MNARARLILTVGVLGALVLMAVPGSAHHLPGAAADSAEAHTHGPDGLDLDRRGTTPATTYEVDAHAAWDPTAAWNGGQFANDQPDLEDRAGLPTFHAIYMYPSDAPNRYLQFAGMFEADARQASDLLAVLFGRGLRFDERIGSDGGRYVDVTVVRSRHNRRKLGGSNQFSLVHDELGRLGFTNSNKKYFVWLDAGSRACGQGHLYQDTRRVEGNYNNNGAYRTTAIVYRPYATSDPATGGFCRGRTLLHELGHNMGAIQKVAPHAFDGAHCNDSAEDVMCYRSHTDNDPGGPDFDWNNDDYWDPVADPTSGSTTKLGWWTVNLSRFVCPVTGCALPSTPDF